jgi:hypothetical protein
MFKFKSSQKFRVIANDVSFYATAKDIRSGVGDFISCNLAVAQCLESLERYKSGDGLDSKSAIGQAGMWNGMNFQLNIA